MANHFIKLKSTLWQGTQVLAENTLFESMSSYEISAENYLPKRYMMWINCQLDKQPETKQIFERTYKTTKQVAQGHARSYKTTDGRENIKQ